MAKKKIGFVKLEWACPNCGGKNPGPQKTCRNCGSPQPEDVKFEKPAQDILVTDAKEIASAEAGADVHCPYCGTRNPSDAKICSQCGGDLGEAVARETGQVVGAFQDKAVMVQCPNCGAENPSTSMTCNKCGASLKTSIGIQTDESSLAEKSSRQETKQKSKINPLIIIIPLVVIIIACILIILLVTQRTENNGTVVGTHWERSISIEEFGAVEKTAWIDQIPDSAKLGACSKELHHTSDQPAASSTEICGTPYVVDDGSGYGEVVEDCVYDVYMDRCNYSIEEWYYFDSISVNGNDPSPYWPDVNLTPAQREGTRKETYQINFDDGGQILSYVTGNYDEFRQFSLGSEWLLTLNGLNEIVDIRQVE